MKSFRSFNTSVLIVLFLFQNSFFVFAEEGVLLHSLEELPSFQQEVEISEDFPEPEESIFSHQEVLPDDDLESLIAAKQAFEIEQKKTLLEMPSLSTILDSNTLLWGLGQTTLADNFLTANSTQKIETFFPATEFVSEKSQRVFASSREKTFRVPADTKLGNMASGIFKKNPTQVKLQADTTVNAADGSLIDPATIGLYEAENSKVIKANTYHDKKMKKKGTKKKGFATNEANTFEFGIPGTHLIFSKPVEITLSVPNFSDGILVDIATLHEGDTDFNTTGLSSSASTACNADGTASIPGSTVTVKNGKVTFYTCGASSFTMNPSGGTAGSNDIRVIIGDCAQVQLYYNNLMQIYTGNPPATGCSTASNMDAWPVLRVGGTSYGNDFGAWASSTTTGSTIGNTYTATTTMTTPAIGGLTYQVIIDWSHTAPNKYFTWSWRVIVPAGNTLPIKFYYGMDSLVA